MFFTKRGWLTPYAMSCGYLHVTENNKGYIELSQGNDNVYDIKLFPKDAKDFEKRVWERVEGIKEARKLYKALCGGHCARRDTLCYERKNNAPLRVYA